MNYFELLNCSETANNEQIKAEYKILVRSAHPDKGGSEKKFQELTNAKEVLTDREKRNQYVLWVI